jgi:hypothetical protein
MDYQPRQIHNALALARSANLDNIRRCSLIFDSQDQGF